MRPPSFRNTPHHSVGASVLTVNWQFVQALPTVCACSEHDLVCLKGPKSINPLRFRNTPIGTQPTIFFLVPFGRQTSATCWFGPRATHPGCGPRVTLLHASSSTVHAQIGTPHLTPLYFVRFPSFPLFLSRPKRRTAKTTPRPEPIPIRTGSWASASC